MKIGFVPRHQLGDSLISTATLACVQKQLSSILLELLWLRGTGPWRENESIQFRSLKKNYFLASSKFPCRHWWLQSRCAILIRRSCRLPISDAFDPLSPSKPFLAFCVQSLFIFGRRGQFQCLHVLFSGFNGRLQSMLLRASI